jgi:hypothetical protein
VPYYEIAGRCQEENALIARNDTKHWRLGDRVSERAALARSTSRESPLAATYWKWLKDAGTEGIEAESIIIQQRLNRSGAPSLEV